MNYHFSANSFLTLIEHSKVGFTYYFTGKMYWLTSARGGIYIIK